jgi:hypothetical protein
MPLDSLFVLTVTAASLLSGIGCPLVAWLAFKRGQARLQQFGERRFGELTQQLKALEVRLERFEGTGTTPSAERQEFRSQKAKPRWSGPSWPTTGIQQRRDPAASGVDGGERPLIAVPNLAAAANDRDLVVNGLTQRYAAIWSLAASGSSAEVIARATGQPIGQIELILGLRRQIDGTRTTIPHASHT